MAPLAPCPRSQEPIWSDRIQDEPELDLKLESATLTGAGQSFHQVFCGSLDDARAQHAGAEPSRWYNATRVARHSKKCHRGSLRDLAGDRGLVFHDTEDQEGDSVRVY